MLMMYYQKSANVKNNKKIYNEAFRSDITGLYSANKMLDTIITEVPYFRALNCFKRAGKTAEQQRRALLYEYAKSTGMGADKYTDTINTLYPSLSSDNKFLKRVLNNICQVYTLEPTRTFSENVDNEYIQDILKDIRFDQTMNEIHQILKLSGKVAVRPVFNNRKLQLDVLYSDEYVSVYNEFGVMVELYKPFIKIIPNLDGTSEEVQRFEYWTKDIYKELDVSGNTTEFDISVNQYRNDIEGYANTQVTMSEYKHNYGVIPYIELTFESSSEDNQDFWELVKTQLQLNHIDMLINENIIYSAMSIGIGINMDMSSKPRMSPGMIFEYKNVQMNEMSDLPPSLEYITPTTFFTELQELKETIKRSAMKDMGLPSSLISDTGQLSSGIALKLDRKELEEVRLTDVSALRQIDKDLIKHILTICKNDRASIYNINFDIGAIDIFIDYSELNVDDTFEQMSSRYDYKRNKGLIDPRSYVVGLTENETITSNEEAIAYIKANKDLFKQLEESDGSNTDGNDANNANNAGTQV